MEGANFPSRCSYSDGPQLISFLLHFAHNPPPGRIRRPAHTQPPRRQRCGCDLSPASLLVTLYRPYCTTSLSPLPPLYPKSFRIGRSLFTTQLRFAFRRFRGPVHCVAVVTLVTVVTLIRLVFAYLLHKLRLYPTSQLSFTSLPHRSLLLY
jgi:hypothetical protein